MFQVSSFKFQVLNKIFAVLVTALGFSSIVVAQENPPVPLAPRSVTIPTPQEKTLPNGLRVIVITRKNVPLVTAQLLIKNGGEVDPQNFAGTADMTAQLLTKGTKTRTATQIAEQIEFLGGSLESSADWDGSEITF
ncbi:MAG: insulinase family protein, partial [Pyrinomonadaceae bacterium]|nr:insulinase family protein [Pyrinomonadaceae bacterium]